MKPLKHLPLFLITLLIFSNCKEETIVRPLPESGYPSSYTPLSNSAWIDLKSKFDNINFYDGLSLNEYGFVTGKVQTNPDDSISKEFVISKIDSFITKYRDFMGIPEDEIFTLENQILIKAPYLIPGGRTSIGSFYDDKEMFPESWEQMIKNVKYKFYLVQNRINGKYISGPELAFDFKLEEGYIEITGNWFPEVKIPADVIYSEDEAFRIARNEVLKRNGRDIWETKYNFHSHIILLKIKQGNSYEIRDCWCVNTVELPYTGYTIAVYVDTQTGEVAQYIDKS